MYKRQVLGRIAAGFSTAVSGGLHPLKRSPRVAPELPSPRSPSPKDFFWGPVMPGYPTPLPDSDEVKGGQSTMVIRQTVQLEQTQTSNNGSDADIGLRQAIPIMPMSLAVICCVLNAISPGLGKIYPSCLSDSNNHRLQAVKCLGYTQGRSDGGMSGYIPPK